LDEENIKPSKFEAVVNSMITFCRSRAEWKDISVVAGWLRAAEPRLFDVQDYCGYRKPSKFLKWLGIRMERESSKVRFPSK